MRFTGQGCTGSWTVAVTCVLATVVLLGTADLLLARGAGADYYLLDANGVLLRKLDANWWSVVDPSAERVYKWKHARLQAFAFDGNLAWEKSLPDERTRYQPLPEGRVAIFTGPAVRALAAADGNELWRAEFKGLPPVEATWFPGPRATGTDAVAGFIVHQPGSTGQTADPPKRLPTVSRLDLRAGRVDWTVPIPWPDPTEKIWSVQPGVIGYKPTLFFDPRTGEMLKDANGLRAAQDRAAASAATRPAPASAPALPEAVLAAVKQMGPGVTLVDDRRPPLALEGKEGKRPGSDGMRFPRWAVLGLSDKDGKVLWHWPVPDPLHGFDSFSVEVHRVKSGILVRAEWIILD